jgi:hypothetical protein
MLLNNGLQHFDLFCTWVLSKNPTNTDLDLNDLNLNKWIQFYNKIKSERVLKIEYKKSISFSAFMSFYIYHLCTQNENSKVIVISDKNEILLNIDSISRNLNEDNSIKKVTANSINFSNKSKVTYQRATSYNIKNEKDIDLVFFDNIFIANKTKLLFDIDLLIKTVSIKKIIFTLTNDISLFNIKEIELK